jgi:outer membrane protein OmpA-like peptidoglycan-associated protein
MTDSSTPTDWAADVKRYVPDADDAVIKKIVTYCGIALRTRDASLVSFTDTTETDRVRENFCKKKLGLEQPDDVLDAAIASVGERMSDTNFRNRVTVYYLLAEHFGKLGLFGAADASAPVVPLAAAAAAAVGTGATEAEAAETDATETDATETDVAETDDVAAPAAEAPPAQPLGLMGTSHGAGASGDGGVLGLAVPMFLGAAAIMFFTLILGSYVGGRFDKDVPVPAVTAPAEPAAPTPEPSAPAIPEGAGIVSDVVEGRPKVSVFFDVGKNDIAPGFTEAVAPVKAWLDTHPADRVQLSGFTDPTGNAAANAELAKRRAQAVKAALTDEGVAADRIDLVKPEDSSDAAVDLAGARRVEITVTPG